MDQFALAADEIERLRSHNQTLTTALRLFSHVSEPRRWWQWGRK